MIELDMRVFMIAWSMLSVIFVIILAVILRLKFRVSNLIKEIQSLQRMNEERNKLEDEKINRERNLQYRVALRQWGRKNIGEQIAMRSNTKSFLGRIAVLNKPEAHQSAITLFRYLGQNYFATTAHTFTSSHSDRREATASYNRLCDNSTAEITVRIQDQYFYLKPKDFIIDFYRDLAVAIAPKNLDTDLELDTEFDLNIGQVAYMGGFPWVDLLVSKGEILHIFFEEIWHDCLSYYGSSGGPVFVNSVDKKILIAIQAGLYFKRPRQPSYRASYKAITRLIQSYFPNAKSATISVCSNDLAQA